MLSNILLIKYFMHEVCVPSTASSAHGSSWRQTPYRSSALVTRGALPSPDPLQEPLIILCLHSGGLEPPLLYTHSFPFTLHSLLNCQRCICPFSEKKRGGEWEQVNRWIGMGIQLGMNRKGNRNFLMGMGGNGSTNGMYSRSQSAFYRASARDIDIAVLFVHCVPVFYGNGLRYCYSFSPHCRSIILVLWVSNIFEKYLPSHPLRGR